ncbi:MAG: HU family DNA-binding protein [Paludibacteraceae bacterium]
MAKGKGIQAELARALGISQKEAMLKLNVFVEEIDAQLQNGKQIAFLGVGVLETRKREARSVVNPATKERVLLPERMAPAFRVSGTFKEKLKS